ncbi:MAG: helix-turn-helix domain-containing protein [Sedimentisphaerales bacterium]|nr:helix-turn-helix domain-containing protein [Sedimentisphaerales bacterium]
MNTPEEQATDPVTIQGFGDPPMTVPLLVDFKTAAKLIGVGVSTLYAMDRSGELGPQGIRLRRRRLWPQTELVAWVRAGCPRREKWATMSRT